MPEENRTQLKQIGSGYRQQLEQIFEAAVYNGDVRSDVDCHFAAQAVIGVCNAFGDLIVRDPELDLFDIIQKCSDMLLRGVAAPP